LIIVSLISDLSSGTENDLLFEHSGSRDGSSKLMDQLSQQRALIESLMSDREKVSKGNIITFPLFRFWL